VKNKPILIGTELTEPLPLVWADPVRVRQIALNLMSNAIKFTKAGSVTIRAEAENAVVSIAVVDTGIGIAESALSHLFERFQQGDSDLNPRQGSTGLGLHISKQLAQMHGGDLTVSSRLNEGSTFRFTLPVAENSVGAPRPVTMPGGSVTVFKASSEDDRHDPER
jgi:signal transduction histidine kinase